MWTFFIYFAIAASVLWLTGAVLSICHRKQMPALSASVAGSAVFFAFIVWMWAALERPPLRTMGETRLWYSFFLSVVGIAVYARWKYRWVLSFSALMSIVFTCINVFKPEIHDKALMPALQSPWFVPHVIVYMFSYAMMGAATVFAMWLWWKRSHGGYSSKDTEACTSLVRLGWGFLTLGMVMGSLWAKQAWGDFWTWDPKETWAAATWVSYLLYLHLRPGLKDDRVGFIMLIISFVLLQMCWWGINYLPAAQGLSVHTY